MRRWLTTLVLTLPGLCDGQVDHSTYYVNEYSAVVSFNTCTNKIIVEDASEFGPGDTVMLIQMKGATIDSSNTPAFGGITDYGDCGNFEFNYVRSVSADTIELKNRLTRSYNFPAGRVQLIRIPYFINLLAANYITCPPWDGKTGGVLAFIVRDTLRLDASLDISGTGFRGGKNYNILPRTMACSQSGYYYDSASWQNGRKGEGISSLGWDKWNGKGRWANGGGGGNGHNSGGGGGGNVAGGGFGGYQLDSCNNPGFDSRGIGGVALNYSNNQNKIFLGGGGGAGHMDSNNPFFIAAGGNGGGIMIIKAKYLVSNGQFIASTGGPGVYQYCVPSCDNDGMGGGGSGGTVLLDIENYLDSVIVYIQGGDGGHVLHNAGTRQRTGPGGGGSGGVVWFARTIPFNARINKTGGANGVIYPDGLNPYGATAGITGMTLDNLNLVFDSVAFQPALSTFTINPPVRICKNDSVMLQAGGGDTYFWTPGNSNLPNPVVSPTVTTNYSVLITDTICNRSVDLSTTVTIQPLPLVQAGKSNDIDCSRPRSQLSASGAVQYTWSPTGSLINPGFSNPVAIPAVTTLYTVKGTDLAGCSNYDSVTVNVNWTGSGSYLMSTAFTPNDDGRNDCYGVRSWGAVLALDFSIYNRWGQRVFHTSNPGDCWDGTYKGLPQGAGVFIYMIKAKTACEADVFRKGTFVLIR